MTSDCVDFVDEDNARRILLTLLKQVAHAACADADEHLHEIRAGDREERNVSFAGYSSGEQSLASSRRANQQHALGNASAKFLELLRFAQELYDLFQLFFRFIHTRDVLERHFFLLHGEQTGPTLAE